MMASASVWILLAGCVAVLALTWAATGLALGLLRRFGVQDLPNQRSSHSEVKPRGGGLAVLLVLVPAWLLAAEGFAVALPGFHWVLAGTLLIVAISLLDDLRSVPAALRFATHILAVALGIAGIGEVGPVFQGLLPPLLDRIAAGFLWLWFLNLYNFMDGIDGITGTESVALGLGIGLVAWLAGSAEGLIALPLLLAAGAAGFLIWNWAPAKLFIGDVGSVPLGYLLGWLLLLLAADGHWASAAILPLYYLADASYTLIRRALRGEPFWRAHRQHFYQRAALARASHAAVVLQIMGLDAVLVGLALIAASGYPWAALGSAVVALLCLLAALERQARAAA